MTRHGLRQIVAKAKNVEVPVMMRDDVIHLLVNKRDLMLNALCGDPEGPAPWRVASEPGAAILRLDIAQER